MVSYVKDSSSYLEAIEQDISFNLQEISRNANGETRRRINRVFEDMEKIHKEFASKWARQQDREATLQLVDSEKW